MTPCKVALRLEDFCKIFFDLERSSNHKWRVLETSFTDVLIAAFRASGAAQVNVDASIEKKTGADFEVMLSPSSGLPLVFIIQAKRAAPSSKKSTKWSYRELFHKPKKSSKFQVETLVDYCAFPHPFPHIPLYAFYHSQTAASTISSEGITCLHASDVHSELPNKLARKRGLHLCSRYAARTFPFHDLFCSGCTGTTTALNAIKRSYSQWDNADWEKITYEREEYENGWLSFDQKWGEAPATNARLLIKT